ncbi:uncharacterized protein LOC143338659 [Chaetodon auriga]|uniref:uncharacterized protein LOC143338659 n=1 Tax=Chaetodon auriga TaxID=39042 RepID=UPI004032DA5F
MPSLDVTQDNSPVNSLQNNMPSSELSGQVVAEQGTLNVNQSDDMSSTLDGSATRTIGSFSEQSVKCVSVNTTKASLEATRDISEDSVMEDSQPPLETSGQNMAKIQTSAEGTHGTHPANVTHDISSSTDMSVQVAATQFSTSDVQCNTSSKNVTLELPGEPGVTSDTVEANSEELLISHDNELTSKVPQPSPKRARSLNSTFDRKKSTGNTILAEAVATVCLQNVTFETKSSEQNGTITLSETSSSDSHHNTLDKPSPPEVCNATSSPKHNNSDVHPPEQSKHNGTTSVTDPEAKMADTPESTPESTFEANPTVDVASEAGHHETKDHLQSGLPMRDGLSDTLGHQSMDAEDNKANTLNLDDTLDLRADCLVTSTPMTNKISNIHTAQDESKAMGAQKKLYGDGPSKPGGQAPSDVPLNVPSNIICDRKTLLTQPAAVSLLPPLKAASKLLKCKLASTLSGRAEPLMSGLPMTRQRTQAMMRQKTQSEALRNTAASDAPQKNTGISTSSNSRATLTGSKQPSPGKPRLGGIPSGIQRAALGLRPPSARSNVPASSRTDQLRGPTASNHASKILQAAKHPLTGGEALPVAKKKKMDAPLPSGSAEAPKSSSVAANRTKNLKQPTTNQRTLPAKTQRDDAAVPASTAETLASCNAVSRAKALKQPVSSHRSLLSKPPIHGCAKCAVLEQQLEMKSEEIRRLKEELLKYSNPEEDC